MPEETGGINYPIKVTGDFKQLEKFNEQAQKAIDSLEKVKKLTSSGIVGSGGPRNKGASSAQGTQAKQLSLVEKHTKRIAEAQKNLNAARNKEVRAKNQTLNVSKKIFDIENQIEQASSKKTNNRRLTSLQNQLAVYRKIQSIGKQQEVLASQEVKTLSKGLSIRRQHFSLDVRENDIANQKLQARKFEVAQLQKKLSLANRLKAAQATDASEIAKVKAAEKLNALEVEKSLLSRQDLKDEQRSLSIQKARVSEELKSAKLQDKKLASKKRSNAIDEKKASLERQLAALQDKGIRQLNSKLAIQREALDLQERAAAAARRAQDVDKRGELQAQERINKALEHEVAFRRQIEKARQLASAGRTNEQAVRLAGLTPAEVERMGISMTNLQKKTAQTVPWIQRLRNSLRGVKDTLEKVTGASSGLFFTFRRLIGVLALFTIARQVTQELTNMAKAAINFNAQLEKVRLGVASVIIATGQVFSPVGEALTDAGEQLQFATVAAQDQLNKLRIDALRTSATFEDLSEAFQTAIGPGLSAGLDLEKVREFSVQISQAATAIGVQQNQLAEEIRSILQGTIQIRTTRIAAVLGITNEDIRQAKELGRLSEFLNERFQSFSAAGRESLKNFDTIVTNLADSFKQLLGRGSLDFFNSLKGLLSDIKDDIASVNEATNQFDLNPSLVRLVQELSDGFQSALENATAFREELTANDLLPSIQATANVVEFLGGVFGGLIQGTVRGLRDVSVVAGKVTRIVATLTGVDLSTLATDITAIVESVVRIGIAFGAAKLSVLAFTATLSLATTALKVFTVTGTALAGMVAVWKSMSFYVSALVVGAATFSEILTVIKAKVIAIKSALLFWPIVLLAAAAAIVSLWDYMDRIGKFILSGLLAKAFEKLKGYFQEAKTFIADLIDQFITRIRKDLLTYFKAMFSILGTLNKAAKEQAEKIGRDIDNLDTKYSQRKKKRLEELAKKQEEYAENILNLELQIAQGVEQGKEQPAIWERAANWIKEGYDNLVDFDSGIDDVVAKSDRLTSKLSELPAIIAASSNGFKEAAATIKQMSDSVESLQDKLSVGVATLGSSGGEDLQAAKLQAEAAVRVRQKAKLLDKEILQLRGQQEALAVREVRIQADINRLSEEDKADGLEAAKASEAFLAARLKVTRAENEVAKLGQGQQKDAAKDLLGLAKDTLALRRHDLDEIEDRIRSEGNSEVLGMVAEELEIKGRIRALGQIISDSELERGRIVEVSNKALALELQLRRQIIEQKTKDILNPIQEVALKKQIQAIDSSRFLTEQQKRQSIVALRAREIGKAERQSELQMNLADAALTQKLELMEQLELSPDLEEAARKRLQNEIARLEVMRQQHELLSAEADNRAAGIQDDQNQDELNNSGPGTAVEEILSGLTSLEGQIGTHAQNWAALVAAPFDGMHQGLMSGMQKYLTETGNAMDIVHGLGIGIWQSLSSAVSKYLADMIAGWAIALVRRKALEKVSTASTLASSSAASTALTAIWSPAALAASIATLGGAVVSGTAAFSAAIAGAGVAAGTIGSTAGTAALGAATGGYSWDILGSRKERGFAGGGDTRQDSPLPQKRRRKAKRRPGSVDPRDKLPAWFRLGEYIIRPEAVNMYGRGLLDAINSMKFDPLRYFGVPQMAGMAQAQFAMQNNVSAMATDTIRIKERGFATGGPSIPSGARPNSGGPLDAFDNEPMTLILVRDMAEAKEVQERTPGPSRIQSMINTSISENNQ